MAQSHPDLPFRRSIRLPDYDYSQSGAYFVTICIAQRACVLGEILDGEMLLSTLGCVVDERWLWLQKQYAYVELDAYMVMPNHLHGIIFIAENAEGDSRIDGSRAGGSRTAPTPSKTLGRLIGAFKTTSTKKINHIKQTPGVQLWQRNYYEHIIRNEADLNRIREYILYNPARWEQDTENPATTQ